MARQVNRLSPRFIETHSQSGYYADGGNLYLQITASGGRSWIFRYRRNGRLRDMGLGAVRDVSLKQARIQAQDLRGQVREGIDPIENRRRERAARLAEAGVTTFSEAAEAYIRSHKAGWKNRKHEAQWASTLETYAYPVIGGHDVEAIEPDHLLKILDPIWREKTETATRVRQRVERVLDYAKARKWRHGENPARWRGGLESLLPNPSILHKVKHHPAMPYDEIGAFMEKLRQKEGVTARCLEVLILTAVRTSDAIKATWDEVDLDKATWTIPGPRLKGRLNRSRDLVVPLCDRVMTILRELAELRTNGFVFPSPTKVNAGLSDAAMANLLKRMKVSPSKAVVHGFRSTFTDWSAEESNASSEVREMCLAHAIPSAVEAAYRRGDLFEKRRTLMDAWSRHCSRQQATAEVVPILKGRTA
jgi:integrase